MKILQNETSNATTPNDNITEKEKLQHPPIAVEKRKAKTLKNKILQNVAEQQQQQQQKELQQQQKQPNVVPNTAVASPVPPIAMTDELLTSIITTPTTATTTTAPVANNNNNNNNISRNTANDLEGGDAGVGIGAHGNVNHRSKDLTFALNYNNSNKNKSQNNSSGNNNNSSDLIIAEAAKILLKNGLNGTNAAAAAAVATATATLLTAAANFQLPQQHHLPQASTTTSSSSPSSTSSESSSTALATNAATSAAAAAHAQLVAIAAAAAAVNATNHQHHKRLSNSLTALNQHSTASSKSFQNPQLNNGLFSGASTNSTGSSTASSAALTSTTSSTSAQFAKPFKSSSSSTSHRSSTQHSSKMPSTCSMDMGVIDYTINSSNINHSSSSTTSSSSSVINLSAASVNTTANSHHKFINSSHNSINSSHHNRSDIGRPPISSHASTNNHNHNNAGSVGGAGGFGGRLQFFKDGKFILELARSKDGEKGGWVSVPRKIFRTPSAATSSTVTPSATASTSAGNIPSPLSVPPTAVISGGVSGGVSYPKNECSNSLSFSDDNSSLQSSPWQRDHCWKQAAPRKNVSKEMATFYHKPAFRIFTPEALLLTRRKRRKPYDTKILENGSTLFGYNRNNVQQVDNGKLQLNTDVDTKINTNDDKKDGEVTESLHIKQSSETTNEDMKVECVDPTNNDGAKEVCKDLNEEATKGLIHQQTDVCDDDVEMVKMSPIKADTLEIENETPPADSQVGRDDVQRMNTSDCDGVDKDSIVGTSMKSSSLNGNVSNEDSQNNVPGTTIITPAPETETECNKQGDEEKRLKKPENIKNRAKLNTIVQKLMDASASRIAAHSAPHSFKNSTQQDSPSTTNAAVSFTPPNTSSLSISSISLGGTSGGSKNQNPKVSPPSNTAASRLVEYHQQHVSPRKRILREFEKVSLEDNSAAAGGKRSRAKGNNIVNSTSGHSQNLASSQMNKGTSSIVTHTSNSGNQSKHGVTSTSTTAPTKLYSSYSIHSLLGGSTGSSASVSTSSSSLSSKKSSDLPATITSYHQQQQQHQSPTSHNVSHHQSPKSPDGNAPSCGGKSPSNSASKFKRSSPYSSPMRESHSRSPTSISGGLGYEYGRRSPRLISDVYNKMKYAGQSDTTGSPQHNPQHYHHAPPPPPQSYYSPYMTTSPHYVPPSSSLAAASALSPPPTSAATSGGTPSSNTTVNSSRSPRHQHSSAFRATTPTSSTTMVGASISNHSTNIPSTPRGDLSPQRSTTASPRETTPRTVPKKTASIRRQFASPTTTNNNSSCPSPTTENRSEENDRRTPLSHQQHLLHRASPGSANMQSGSPLHHTYSYMYAHGANSPHHPASAVSPTTSNPSSAAAAAAIASYIPAVVGSAYYHPYISTLAAMRHPQMWMQHYQNAAVAAANPALLQASRHPAMLSAAAAAGAAARLSPPYHGYQYNGVNNAAMAAAAAAGFGGGPSSATPPHHHAGSALPPPHGSMFNSMVHGGIPSSHPAAMNATAAATAGLVPASASVVTLGSVQPMTDTTDLSKASKNNYSSSSSSSLASSSPLPGTGNSAVSSISATTSHSSMYPPTRNKDEQSSDVPLNLSKH